MSEWNVREVDCGSVRLCYHIHEKSQTVGFSLVPTSHVDSIVPHRDELTEGPEMVTLDRLGWKFPAMRQCNLINCHMRGDPLPGDHLAGHGYRGASAGAGLKFESQVCEEDESSLRVITRLTGPILRGLHTVLWRKSGQALEVWTEIENTGDDAVTVEALSSAVLNRITPFASDQAPERLFVHRFRSNWSSEGRPEIRSAEELHLEPTWAGFFGPQERFGQTGSLPVRNWFPQVLLEDRAVGVFWGMQLACPGSWQMAIHRRDDFLSIEASLADRDSGHWWKTLAPGDRFRTPSAFLACVAGNPDDACATLQRAHEASCDQQPSVEQDLPIMFNEWCTSWGFPTHDHIVNLARRLRGSGTKYLVMDAGWYCRTPGNWGQELGDWKPNPAFFPQGLRATCDAVRAEGLIPGIWFEFESVGGAAEVLSEHPDWMLTRDGVILQSGGRRFLDFRKPEVQRYAEERVIGLLRDNDIGYMKIDYNESLGMGCDGAESPGEGLRQHLEAVQVFMRRVREALPDLVMEICASGGHRLEPSFLEIGAIGSSSDAHEARECPIIAANLHSLMLPRQSQVWATLRKDDDPHRLVYSLAAGFLGRLCLSGDLPELSEAQWRLVREACALYPDAVPILRRGKSQRSEFHGSYRQPRGSHYLLRYADDGNRILAVCHAFAEPSPLQIPLSGSWAIAGSLSSDSPLRVEDSQLIWEPAGDWRAAVAILRRR